jgi:hypothetical protein
MRTAEQLLAFFGPVHPKASGPKSASTMKNINKGTMKTMQQHRLRVNE